MTQDFKPHTILMVDDVIKNLEVLGNILGTGGRYNLYMATNGLEAIRVAEDVQPDLILLDVMMPELDGFEVCRQIKQSSRLQHVPIIFLTAKTESEDIVKGFSVGAADYVAKPFRSEELLARVQTQLALKSSQDEQNRLIQKQQQLMVEKDDLIYQLKEALEKVKLLSGLLPICSNCKKIRDDSGYWQQVEEYISRHSEAIFSHGVCPECIRTLYPEVANEVLKDQTDP